MDERSLLQADAFAAVRRSARAAEKRLNATEAEIRFASDIAAGIYTEEMIPPVMDSNKIMELVDFYIAELAFGYDLTNNAYEPTAPSTPSLPPEEVPPPSVPDSPSPERRSPSRKTPWMPLIVSCVLAIGLISVAVYDAYFIDPSEPDSLPAASGEPVSRAVDYETDFVGSVNSKFVHRTYCRFADNILAENRVHYKTAEDAVADGRSKCSECFRASSTGTSARSSTNELIDNFTKRYLELRNQRGSNLPSFFN